MRDLNHLISKKIVSLLCDVVKIESLKTGKIKRNRKGKMRNLKSWSPAELVRFIEYRAGDAGRKVIYINPRHTSQKCSRCGYVSKENRHGSVFKYINCGFKLNANQGTLKCLACLSTSGCSQPANSCCSMKLHSWVEETSYKLRSFNKGHMIQQSVKHLAIL